MDVFGSHSYVDLSDLNAKWDQARPAVAGLGSQGSLSGNSLGVAGDVVVLPETVVYGDPNVQTAGMSMGPNWLLIGAGIAAVAVGGALILKKKRR